MVVVRAAFGGVSNANRLTGIKGGCFKKEGIKHIGTKYTRTFNARLRLSVSLDVKPKDIDDDVILCGSDA